LPALHSFPTRRSSDLKMDDRIEAFESFRLGEAAFRIPLDKFRSFRLAARCQQHLITLIRKGSLQRSADQAGRSGDENSHITYYSDRKSTRLNSSHSQI